MANCVSTDGAPTALVSTCARLRQVATTWAVEHHLFCLLLFIQQQQRSYVHRPRGVTVSILDSESSDRGSNPREAFHSSGLAVNHFPFLASV